MKNNKTNTPAAYEMPSARVVGLNPGSAILAGSLGDGTNESYSGYEYDWTDDLN